MDLNQSLKRALVDDDERLGRKKRKQARGKKKKTKHAKEKRRWEIFCVDIWISETGNFPFQFFRTLRQFKEVRTIVAIPGGSAG